MTTREILVDDLAEIEDVLLALGDVSNKRNLTEKGIITIIVRAIYHILTYAIRLMEKEGRKS